MTIAETTESTRVPPKGFIADKNKTDDFPAKLLSKKFQIPNLQAGYPQGAIKLDVEFTNLTRNNAVRLKVNWSS